MDADELYGAPLDQFVPERTALVRALRADGRREEAADAAALRKPSVAAWAVNQLIRTQGRDALDLFDAGDKLLAAHEEALAGRGDGRALRAASERERAAVDTLVNAARGLLTSDGHELSRTIVDRVTDTLHAAALDLDAREAVRGGRLVRELRHVGLGMVATAGPTSAPVAPPRRPAAGSGARASATKAPRDAGAKAARAAETKAARAAESAARRTADRAAQRVQLAEARRETAAKELREAEEALATARRQADAAAGAYRDAQRELKRL